jgi:hypothetical protein
MLIVSWVLMDDCAQCANGVYSTIDGQEGLIRQPFLLLLTKGHRFVAKHLGPLVLLHVGPNQNQNQNPM